MRVRIDYPLESFHDSVGIITGVVRRRARDGITAGTWVSVMLRDEQWTTVTVVQIHARHLEVLDAGRRHRVTARMAFDSFLAYVKGN